VSKVQVTILLASPIFGCLVLAFLMFVQGKLLRALAFLALFLILVYTLPFILNHEFAYLAANHFFG
jgi:hypothetical protein